MKSINFIKNIDPHKHRFIHGWIYCSGIVIILLSISLAAFSIHQYHTYSAIQEDYARLQTSKQQLHTILQEKRTLKTKADFLKKQCAKITKIKERPTNPAQILKLFITSTELPVILENLQINKKNINITLSGNSTEHILQYIHNLSEQKLLNHIEIISIEPSEQQVKAVVSALLT